MSQTFSISTTATLSFEVSDSTYDILQKLRAPVTGSQNIVLADRRTGKTTALMLRALELAADGAEVVVIAPNQVCSDISRKLMHQAVASFGQTVAGELAFQSLIQRIHITDARRGENYMERLVQKPGVRVLVDEPQLFPEDAKMRCFRLRELEGVWS